MGKELGLVRGHVHVGGAVAPAALAGQAQVQGVPHRLAAPAVLDGRVAVAVQHLEQQPGAAPGRVLFLVSDLVGRAHHGAALVAVLAALADADAPVGGLGERAAVVREAEEEVLRGGRGPVAAQPQVLVQPRRAHDLAGVHRVAGVEDRLQLLKRSD